MQEARHYTKFEEPWHATSTCAVSQLQCCPCFRCPSPSYMGSMTGWTPRLASASARTSAGKGGSSAPQTWRWRSYQTQVCDAFVCRKLWMREGRATEPCRTQGAVYQTQVHKVLCTVSCIQVGLCCKMVVDEHRCSSAQHGTRCRCATMGLGLCVALVSKVRHTQTDCGRYIRCGLSCHADLGCQCWASGSNPVLWTES